MLPLIGLLFALQTPVFTFPEDELCNMAVAEDFDNIGDVCAEAASVWALRPKTPKNQIMEALTHFESGVGYFQQHNRNDAITQLSTACSLLARLHLEGEYAFVFKDSAKMYPGVFPNRTL